MARLVSRKEDGPIDGYLFRNWNRAVSDMIAASDGAALLDALVGGLDNLAPLDSWMAALFRRGAGPVVFGYAVPDGKPDRYGDGPFLLDPFYDAFTKGLGPGCFLLEDLAPDNFRKSEFYQTYYRRFAFIDEAGYLIPLDTATTAHLSLSRSRYRSRFSPAEVASLRDVIPVVEGVFRRLWAWRRDGALGQAGGAADSTDLEAALSDFGTSDLTARERDIGRLVLRGHSAKAIAARLDIAPGTVRTHIKSIYAKLGVSSQAELFSVFIDQILRHAARRASATVQATRRRAPTTGHAPEQADS